MRHGVLGLIFLWGASLSLAQEVGSLPNDQGTVRDWNEHILEAGRSRARSLPDVLQDYRIGPEDLIEVAVFEVPELSRTVRVSASGEVSLPLIGSIKARGMSPLQLEQVLTDRLRGSYLQDPQVSVFLREYRSDPVSVMGAVKMPGLYQIQTQKSLIEVLAMAQGFSEGPQHQPGRTIVITRKPATRWVDKTSSVPEEGSSNPADPDVPTGGMAAGSLEIPIKQLLQSGDPKWNVPLYPGDVVKVAPAGTFYVAGNVNRPGGFPLTDFDNISVIQALAMAGGSLKSASLKSSVIIRRDSTGNRVEEMIDLRRVLKGKDPETMLGANDILFVPGSVGKAAALRAIETSIQLATGVIIWRR